MPNIRLKRSAVSGNVPTTDQIELGEIALNTYDGKAFIKKNVNGNESVVEVGSTASYLNPLNQTVQITGSLIVTGSNTLIGNTSLTGSFAISGSEEITGYIKFLPVSTNIDNSVSASYIYVSGSTNDLYFTQNGNGYANTTRLRWLEGNLYTGLLHGGLITAATGSTTFNVGSGSGIIVYLNASLTDDPYPTVQYINWDNLTNQSLTYLTSSIQTFVGINSSGSVVQQTNAFNDGQYNTVITIGTVLHQNKTTVNASITYPNVAYGYKQRTYDFVKAFGPLKLSGLTIVPTGSLGLTVGSGTAFADGRNYQVDPNNPSYIIDPGTAVSKIFRYYQSGSEFIQDTNNALGYTEIDPANYNNNGTLTPVPGTGANREYSIKRVFWYPNSATKGIVVYYGNATYPTLTDAVANIPYETFYEVENTKQNAVYLGAITIRNNGDFTDPTSYTISPGGIFRQVGGSGGGGAAPSARLVDLADVSITGSTDGQALVYDNTTSKWENSSYISASISGNASTATSSSYAATASFATTAQTASFVTTAQTASYVTTAQTASYVLNAVSASYATTSSYANDFTVAGTLTAQTINVQTITSSIDFITGSSINGSLITNTHQFTGSTTMTGSLTVVGPVNASSFTGSLQGIATTASFVTTAQTASYVLNAVSASYATTASYVANASSFPYTGSAIISGSLSVTGSGSFIGNVGINTPDPSVAFEVNGSTRITGSAVAQQYLQQGGTSVSNRASLVVQPNEFDNSSTAASSSFGIVSSVTNKSSNSGGVLTWGGIFYSRPYGTSTGYTAGYGLGSYALRNNTLDTSTNASNQLIGLITNVGHSTSLNGAATTANVAGVQNTIQAQTGSITNAYGQNTSLAVATVANLTSTVTNFYGLSTAATVGSTSGTGTGTLTNYYDLYLQGATIQTTGIVTNKWGVYQLNSSHANYFAGNIGIGTTTPNTKLDVNGNVLVTGSVTATLGFTGSLQGTATTASFVTTAQTASYVAGANVVGNISGNAATATTASYASTAPYSGLQGTVPTWNQNTTGTAATASYVAGANVAGNISGNAATATTASYASTAPYSGLQGTVPTWNQNTTGTAATASFVTTAQTASYVLNAVSASYATTAGSTSAVAGGTANYIPLWTASTTLSSSVLYQSGGNIGIGTTSPNTTNTNRTTVDINGTSQTVLNFSAGGTTKGYIFNDGTNIDIYSVNDTKFTAGGGEKVRITSAGNVGIGTASPSTKLSISGSNDTASTGVLEIITPSTNLKIGGNSTYSWIQSHNSNPLYINQLGNNLILNSGGGNVGIGTTAPNAKLDVNGNAIITGSLTISGREIVTYANSGTGLANSAFQIENPSGNQNVIANSFAGVLRSSLRGDSSGNLILNASSSNFYFNNDFGSNPTFINGSTIFLTLSGANSTFSGSITTGGSITIGTSGNYVAGSIYSDGNWGMLFRAKQASPGNAEFRWSTSADSELMRISTAGNVGIGITAPTSKLHVYSSATEDGIRIDATTYPELILSRAGAIKAYIAIAGGAGGYGTGTLTDSLIVRSESAYIHFLNSSGVQQTIYGNHVLSGDIVNPSSAWKNGTTVIGESTYNKVIIGSLVSSYTGATIGGHNSALSAWADLNIVGGNIIFRYNETEKVRIDTSGNVGINTSSPNTKLDVNGNVLITGSLTSTGNATISTSVIIGDDTTYGSPYKVVAFGGNSNGYNRIFGATGTTDGLFFAAATGRGFNFRPNGGTSDLVYITSTGILYGTADIRTTRVYDLDNTAYYTDPASTSNLSRVDADSQMRAPIYYDSADTTYYLDPNTTGTSLYVAGNIRLGTGGADTGLRIDNGAGTGDYSRIRFYQAGTNNQTIHVFSSNWQSSTLLASSAGAININGANGVTLGVWNSPSVVADNSGNFYTKIFYDLDNTAYYINPNSNSISYTSQFYGIGDINWYRITNPGGAAYTTGTSSITGAWKIKLPTAKNNSSTMMRMTVKIYQYTTGASHTFEIGGYNYSGGNWYNLFATNSTDSGNNYTIRFGYDSTSDCIWIGETSSTWSYPQVFVTEFQAGFGGQGAGWADGWSITPVTAFDTVEQSRSPALVVTQNNTGALYGSIFYDSDNTGYYLNPNGTSNTSRVDADSQMRAPIYYDSSNTSYYVDPASTSVLNGINIAGSYKRSAAGIGYLDGNYSSVETPSTTGAIYTIGGSYYPTSTSLNTMYGIGYANQFNIGGNAWGMYVCANGNIRHYLDADNGIGYAAASYRAPIFYDYNNTGYYTDPASTSNINVLNAAGQIQSTGGYILGLNLRNAYQVLNLNTIKAPGLYHYDGGISGTQPLGTEWYNVRTIEIGDSARYSQFVMPYSANRIFYRYNDTSWQSYVELLHSSNYTSYSSFTGAVYGTIYYDADNTGYYVNPNGTSNTSRVDADSQMRAPIYYDSSNTSYYVDPAGTSRTGPIDSDQLQSLGESYFRGSINMLNAASSGWITPISRNSGSPLFYGSVYYDQDNTGYYVDPASTSNLYRVDAANQTRSPIYYDSDNTGYYIDAASTSNLYRLTLNPGGSGVATGLYISGGDITAARTSTTGVIYFGTGGSVYLYYDGSNYLFGSAGGYTQNNASFRAPIFYDLDNTSYYIDGASTSNLNALTVVSFTETSSERYKENIYTLDNALDKVTLLRGVSYNRKGNTQQEIGVIAEEVADVLPEVLKYNSNGEPDSVSYGRLTALLIEAMKEQQNQIKELQNEIKTLKQQ